MARGISTHLGAVRERIACAACEHGRSPEGITLIAVSKTKPAAAVAEAHRAGQLDFGENYAQEAAAKIEALAGLPLRWHFIGRIQSNKTALNSPATSTGCIRWTASRSPAAWLATGRAARR